MSSIYCKFWHLWGCKYLEVQTGRFDSANLFSVSFDIGKYKDHPGFSLFFELFYCHFIVTFYDSRHFDEIYPGKVRNAVLPFKLEPGEAELWDE